MLCEVFVRFTHDLTSSFWLYVGHVGSNYYHMPFSDSNPPNRTYRQARIVVYVWLYDSILVKSKVLRQQPKLSSTAVAYIVWCQSICLSIRSEWDHNDWNYTSKYHWCPNYPDWFWFWMPPLSKAYGNIDRARERGRGTSFIQDKWFRCSWSIERTWELSSARCLFLLLIRWSFSPMMKFDSRWSFGANRFVWNPWWTLESEQHDQAIVHHGLCSCPMASRLLHDILLLIPVCYPATSQWASSFAWS